MVIGYDDKGLPITKNVLAKTKTECLAKLKKLQETCAERPNEKLRQDMTFGEWMDFWYQNYSKPKLRPHHTGELRGCHLQAHYPCAGEDSLI